MKSSEKKETPYLIAAIYAAILVGIVYFFWPNVYPWSFTYFWFQVGSLQDWIREVRWWYIIMGIFSIVVFILNKSRREELVSNDPIDYIKSGAVISILAGVFEEICFRWIFFYSAIASVLFINWLFLGFLDINIVKWIYETVLWPIANFFTNGYLMPFMVGMHWSVIAGMLSANVRFRNGHAYQGLLGWINSWFVGMILFYIMFKYGLLAAMTIHFLYDMMLFVLDAILVGIYHLTYGKPKPKKIQFSDIFRKALLETELKKRR